MLNDNKENGHEQGYVNRPSEYTEDMEEEPMYSDDDSSISGLRSEDVE